MTRAAEILVIMRPGGVVGLYAYNGKVAWEWQAAERELGPWAVAITEDCVFIVTQHHLQGVDYRTGSHLWKARTTLPSSDSMDAGQQETKLIVNGIRVFCARRGSVECYSFDGELLWSYVGEPSRFTWLGLPGGNSLFEKS
jgi:outer membrane protein assembly factor BamB